MSNATDNSSIKVEDAAGATPLREPSNDEDLIQGVRESASVASSGRAQPEEVFGDKAAVGDHEQPEETEEGSEQVAVEERRKSGRRNYTTDDRSYSRGSATEPGVSAIVERRISGRRSRRREDSREERSYSRGSPAGSWKPHHVEERTSFSRSRSRGDDDGSISDSIPPTTESLLATLLEETRRLRKNQAEISAILEKTLKPAPNYSDVKKISDGFDEREDTARSQFVGIDKAFFTAHAPGKDTLKAARELFERWLFGHREVELPWSHDLFIGGKTPPSPVTKEDMERLKGIWPRDWDIPLDPQRLKYAKQNNTMVLSKHTRQYQDHPYPRLYYAASRIPLLEELASDEDACGILCDICVDIFSGLIELNVVATILCLSKIVDRRNSIPDFLDGYLNNWTKRSTLNMSKLGSFNDEDHSMFVQHMQSFTVVDTYDARTPKIEGLTGIFCKREKVTLNSPDGRVLLTLRERRFSTCLSLLPVKPPLGSYVLLSVVDDFDLPPKGWGEGVYRTSVSGDEGRWTIFGLLPADSYTGIGVFQLQLCSFIDTWEKDWNATLDRIDSLVSVNLSDLEDQENRKKLMYDTYNLERSDLYFEVLQILRIFSDAIRSSPLRLASLTDIANIDLQEHGSVKVFRGDFGDFLSESGDYVRDVHEVLAYNWKVVMLRYNTAAKSLMERVERKTEEIKSLRDGLFNAQSVREAIKGTQINQYLLVFTVVTILFLPPTFVATFFGMHLFDKSEADETQRQFWTIFGAVSGVTYLAAVAGLSSVSQRMKFFKDAVLQLWLDKPPSDRQTKASLTSSSHTDSNTDTGTQSTDGRTRSRDTPSSSNSVIEEARREEAAKAHLEWRRREGLEPDTEQSSRRSDDSQRSRDRVGDLPTSQQRDHSHIRSGSVSEQPATEVPNEHLDDTLPGQLSRRSWFSKRNSSPRDEEKGEKPEKERGRHSQDIEKVSGEEDRKV